MPREPFRPVGTAASGARCGAGAGAGGEVERPLRVREQAERGGAADVQGAVVAEPAHQPGQVGDGAVEVEGVQGVQPGGEQGGGGGLPVVQPHAAVVQGVLLDRGGLVGVAPQPGLVQDRVQHRQPVVPAGDGQVPVHERDRVRRELGGGLGDPAGLPRLQPAVLDQRPQPREPVAELDRLRHQRQTRRVRESESRGQLLHRVLGHAGGAVPGQRGRVEEPRTQHGGETTGPLGREGRGRVLVSDRVQVDPVHRQRQQVGPPPRRRCAGRRRPRPAPPTRRGRARRVRPRCRSGCWSYRKPRPDHRQFPCRHRRESRCPQGETARWRLRAGAVVSRPSPSGSGTSTNRRLGQLNQRGGRHLNRRRRCAAGGGRRAAARCGRSCRGTPAAGARPGDWCRAPYAPRSW